MGPRAMFLRVGLLIVIGTAALVALVMFLTGTNFSNSIELETYFKESVQGLDVGAPVKYLGVSLGRVTDIGLVSAEYGRGMPIDIRRATYRLVYVRFVVDESKVGRTLTASGVQDAVKAGLRTRVAAQGITGISYLGLDFVTPSEYPVQPVPWQPAYPYVPSVPSTFAQVQSAAERIAAELQQIDFKGIATTLLGLMQELQTELKSGEAHQTLVATTALLESLRKAVDRADLPGLAASLRKTVDQADLAGLSASLRKSSNAVGALAEGNQVRQLIANANHATAEIADAARTLPPLIAGLSRTTNRADTAAADLVRRMTSILNDLQATAGNLRDATDALRAYPAGTLFGGPPPRSQVDRTGGGR
jgi:phospholipid/cholesterol/gamma-HCH transport system substrate-binding protein